MPSSPVLIIFYPSLKLDYNIGYAAIAQVVERSSEKAEVVSASLTRGTLRHFVPQCKLTLEQTMKCFVYIIKCKDNSYYTGITWNIMKRIEEHNLRIKKLPPEE